MNSADCSRAIDQGARCASVTDRPLSEGHAGRRRFRHTRARGPPRGADRTAAARARCQDPGEDDEQCLGQQGEPRDQDAAGEHLPVVCFPKPMTRSGPASHRRRAPRGGGGDHLHGRGPDSCHDQRNRERKLDRPAPGRAHPHAARCVADVGVDLAEADKVLVSREGRRTRPARARSRCCRSRWAAANRVSSARVGQGPSDVGDDDARVAPRRRSRARCRSGSATRRAGRTARADTAMWSAAGRAPRCGPPSSAGR